MGYKTEQHECKLGSLVEDSFGELENLSDEMRNWFDSLPEGLQNGDKGQLINETAEALERVSDVEAPSCIAELAVMYSEQRNTDKRRPRSRQVRFDDAIGWLRNCIEAARDWAEDTTHPATQDHRDAAMGFADEVQQEIDDVDSCEFPAMR